MKRKNINTDVEIPVSFLRDAVQRGVDSWEAHEKVRGRGEETWSSSATLGRWWSVMKMIMLVIMMAAVIMIVMLMVMLMLMVILIQKTNQHLSQRPTCDDGDDGDGSYWHKKYFFPQRPTCSLVCKFLPLGPCSRLQQRRLLDSGELLPRLRHGHGQQDGLGYDVWWCGDYGRGGHLCFTIFTLNWNWWWTSVTAIFQSLVDICDPVEKTCRPAIEGEPTQK